MLYTFKCDSTTLQKKFRRRTACIVTRTTLTHGAFDLSEQCNIHKAFYKGLSKPSTAFSKENEDMCFRWPVPIYTYYWWAGAWSEAPLKCRSAVIFL